MEKMGQGREGAADAKEKKATTTSKMREVRAEQRELKRKAEDEALEMASVTAVDPVAIGVELLRARTALAEQANLRAGDQPTIAGAP